MKAYTGIVTLGVAFTFLLLATSCQQATGANSEQQHKPVAVRAGIDHSQWERLLQQYVDPYGLVNYQAWKASAADLEALSGYLQQFAAEPSAPAQGSEQAASLINAYNAFAISWILENYPTLSIRSLEDSFAAKRHRIGGQAVSLDDIEHGTLRPLLGYRVHATVVCAARSCPPLMREAYQADRLDEQLDQAMVVWLARDDLNRYFPVESKAEVSSIFEFFPEDFEKAGGVRKVLQTHAPEMYRSFLETSGLELTYISYDWGLNDQAREGERYGGLQYYWDEVRKRLG
ncbi:MAG: DUF547 domain-containing protein [Candidatus Binatia bacterium]